MPRDKSKPVRRVAQRQSPPPEDELGAQREEEQQEQEEELLVNDTDDPFLAALQDLGSAGAEPRSKRHLPFIIESEEEEEQLPRPPPKKRKVPPPPPTERQIDVTQKADALHAFVELRFAAPRAWNGGVPSSLKLSYFTPPPFGRQRVVPEKACCLVLEPAVAAPGASAETAQAGADAAAAPAPSSTSQVI